jgi:hypothetical protein
MNPNDILRPHVVLENRHNGMNAIKLTEEPYAGIIFTYGKVTMEEREDSANIQFEYEVLDNAGRNYVKEDFEFYLYEFLQELIVYGVAQNNLTYTGGIDENRTGDPIEPDSE